MLLHALQKCVRRPKSDALRRGKSPRRFGSALALERLDERLLFVAGGFEVVDPGEGYDGVVSINGGCTGALISTGRHVLTAAHCVDGWTGRDGVADAPVSVRFDLPTGPVFMTVPVSSIQIHPAWTRPDGHPSGHVDLAILELPEIAPAGAQRYELHRTLDEVGRIFEFVGYGQSGSGSTADDPDVFDGQKRLGMNRFDAVFTTSLAADFDSGLRRHDSGWSGDLGLGAREAMIAPGDSGGPAFLDGRIAGLAKNIQNYTVDSLGRISVNYGTTGGWERISASASWIDARTNSAYPLVIDMRNQPQGDDGDADIVHLRKIGDRIQVLLDGAVLHEDEADKILSVTIRGSSDQDVVIVSSAVDVVVEVDGRGGSDFLIGPYHAAGIHWYIDTFNGGRVVPLPLGGPTIAFASMENLIGAAANDTFRFANGMGVSGSIDGGAGRDSLYYGAYTTGVNVDLEAGRATAVGAGARDRVFRIENVTGGAAADRLIGNGAANVLRGGGGSDVIYGRGGNDTLYGNAGHDQLFGEAGRDYLFGGSGNDYLDGGHDHLEDVLRGESGKDTFVVHQHQEPVWDPIDRRLELAWVDEDRVDDFDPLNDRKTFRRWYD
jgi:Ca2+-binding RTX toxin-like protein